MKTKYMVVEVHNQSRSLVRQDWKLLRGRILHQSTPTKEINEDYVTVLTLTPDSVVEKMISVDSNDPYTEITKVFGNKEVVTIDRPSWGEIVSGERKADNLYNKVICNECGRFLGFAQGKAVIKCGKCKTTTITE